MARVPNSMPSTRSGGMLDRPEAPVIFDGRHEADAAMPQASVASGR